MTEDNPYEAGTYFALIFDDTGAKQGIMFGTDLEGIQSALDDIQVDEDVEYIILQVVENPRNRALH